MKPNSIKSSSQKNVNSGHESDDDNVRYKINTKYINNSIKSPLKVTKKQEPQTTEDDTVRYMFPTVLSRNKPVEKKSKAKPKIKVNFWSNKQVVNRLHNTEQVNKGHSTRRHTIGVPAENHTAVKQKNSNMKVRKRVSFLPSPLFSENHVPMVTVPDDLTIQLNEEEAHDLLDDLNSAFVNSDNSANGSNDEPKTKGGNSTTQITSKSNKRKRQEDDLTKNQGNENELEFFSKYVVQKLRRMETNQRIYSENLINTVLMLGQLGKLNGKSKIRDA